MYPNVQQYLSWISIKLPAWVVVLWAICIHFPAFSQVNPQVNIANYDYFSGSSSKIDPQSSELQNELDKFIPQRDSVVFDPKTNTYTKYVIRNGQSIPVYAGITIEELLKKEGKTSEENYLNQQSLAMDKLFEFRVPTLYAEKSLYNRVFQNSYVDAPELRGHISAIVDEAKQGIDEIKSYRYKKIKDILPNLLVGFGGTFALQAGYRVQEVRNLSLPESLRTVGSPDFQVNMNFKGDASLSNKLIIPALSFNTFSNFDQDIFKMSIKYKGSSDEILKEIAFIQTNFDTKSSLIPSTESLLGANVKMQFGRLFVTGAIGQVRSQMQTAQVSSGQTKIPFKMRASDYDENQHFFLSQYFHNNYENALRQLPAIQSGIRITRIEVWVTNRQNKTQDVRQALALMDLAEQSPYNSGLQTNVIGAFPENAANSLYSTIDGNSSYRDASQIDNLLQAIGMKIAIDYEKSFMRLLNPNEYYLNDELGYIMLKSPLQSDEVLAVAYEYSAGGKLYQVGEFSNETTPQDPNSVQGVAQYKTATIFLKMLKSTSQNVNIPMWNLMMKNVYSVGYGVSKKEDLKFQILYEQQGGVAKNYIPSADLYDQYVGTALLELTSMDRTGAVQNAAGVDGEFDFITKATFIPEMGKIVFPTKKPFGENLRYLFKNQVGMDNYVFDKLYDTLKAIAKTYTQLDRFLITGESAGGYSSSGTMNIGFNLSPGSVKIYSGSYLLEENKDYFADYNLGTVRIINPTYLNSQVPLRLQYENNNQFGFRNYLLMGLRLDYYFKNKKWILGGTAVNLNETPFYRKLEYSNDPINNSAFQVDLKFRDEMPWLSKALGILPGVDKKQSSSIRAQTELAVLVPGHSSQIGSSSQGGVYIDDFESVRSTIDIKSSFSKWSLASTPEGSVDRNNQILFPEAILKNDLSYGFNRARLSWYVIDPTFQDPDRTDNPYVGNYDELSKSDVRQVFLSELFPNRSRDVFQDRLTTFDMTFYPYQRGPYNFDTRTSQFDVNGLFKAPQTKWAGIMRSLSQIDFVSSNIEYLEFWMLDPFVNKPQSNGGNMYIQLGNISEDILKDGNKAFENGLPTPTTPASTDISKWGKFPTTPTQINFAFTNNPDDRAYQDVGLDGLTTAEEKDTFASFLNTIGANFGFSSPIYGSLNNDPSSDDYQHYSSVKDEFGRVKTFLEAYKYVSNPDGNSPAATSSTILGSFMPPESEDLNNDNVLNQTEAYYQYNLEITPNMSVGTNNIADMKTVSVSLPNGTTRDEKWYLFRVPLRKHQYKYGDISGFQSIRFMRMFLNNFQDSSVTFRFATMQFVINQWRLFENQIDTLGGIKPISSSSTSYALQTVNIEENESKTPVPYVMPPGVVRQTTSSSTSGAFLQNEQSQALIFQRLAYQQSRGIFKNVSYDLRNYDRISMFIHAEGTGIADKTLYALVRLGQDATDNYYEIKIPLKITTDGSRLSADVWPSSNNLDIVLSTLSSVKNLRDVSNNSFLNYFSQTQSNGVIIGVMGNPSLAAISTILLGVQNANNATPVDGELWFNELKLVGLNEQPSWAMTGNVNVRLADFGNLNVSGSYKSIGWGSLEQRLGQRMLEDERQIGISSDFNLHQFLPDKIGLQLPMYVSFSEIRKKPKYFPHASDLLLEQVLNNTPNTDSILQMSINYSSNYLISFPDAVFFKNTPKWFPLSPSLFSFNYTYNETFQYSPQIASFFRVNHQGGVSYNYQVPIGEVNPFKKLNLSNNWKFIKQFNFRYLPSSISINIMFDRLFSKKINRNIDAIDGLSKPYFGKYFNFSKILDVRWPLTKSLSLAYNARQESSVDEPYGDLDTKAKLDSFWKSVWTTGRTNYFTHSFSAEYNVPFKLFSFLSWMNGQLSYNSTYTWRLNFVTSVGNIVQNTQQFNANLELNLGELYLQSRSYRRRMANTTEKLDFAHSFYKTTIQLLTMVKNLRGNYSESYGTIIPGWAPNIETWGPSLSTFNPGLDFLFGYTPTQDWFRNTLIQNNWIISNTLLSSSISQIYRQNIRLTANLVPARDLRIDLNMRQEFTKNLNFQILDVLGNNDFQIYNPMSTGSFSISFLSFTLFSGGEISNLLDVANRLKTNREILSRRLAFANNYANKNLIGNFYEGYGAYSQDVIVPSFVSAFTNSNPENAPLISHAYARLQDNPFRGYFMLPNWTITYSGLTRIPAIKKIFNSLTLSHTYSSSLDMSNYSSSLKFTDPLNLGWPSFIDPKTGNYISYFLLPNVSITEQYNPLILISGVIKTQWQFSTAIKRTRQSTLSLTDYQISEANVFGVSAKVGWTSLDFNLPFSLRFKSKEPSVGNFTLSTDMAVENSTTQNIRMDENILITAGGMDRFNFNINLGMIIDKSFNIQVYFEQLNTYPKLSATPPILVTRVGLKLNLDINYQQTMTGASIVPKGLGDVAPIDELINKATP